eukprot:TRINITY_DN6351_c0_g1_i2.p2 TRINITY_DN6351_c0_g1~~TRINITY_DN6351_c0_g1_i2.p2  ORF type:complete len:112 (-),score=12.49 TRINITY_DN6351_c0_g1_i2:110-445(-)
MCKRCKCVWFGWPGAECTRAHRFSEELHCEGIGLGAAEEGASGGRHVVIARQPHKAPRNEGGVAPRRARVLFPEAVDERCHVLPCAAEAVVGVVRREVIESRHAGTKPQER